MKDQYVQKEETLTQHDFGPTHENNWNEYSNTIRGYVSNLAEHFFANSLAEAVRDDVLVLNSGTSEEEIVIAMRPIYDGYMNFLMNSSYILVASDDKVIKHITYGSGLETALKGFRDAFTNTLSDFTNVEDSNSYDEFIQKTFHDQIFSEQLAHSLFDETEMFRTIERISTGLGVSDETLLEERSVLFNELCGAFYATCPSFLDLLNIIDN